MSQSPLVNEDNPQLDKILSLFDVATEVDLIDASQRHLDKPHHEMFNREKAYIEFWTTYADTCLGHKAPQLEMRKIICAKIVERADALYNNRNEILDELHEKSEKSSNDNELAENAEDLWGTAKETVLAVTMMNKVIGSMLRFDEYVGEQALKLLIVNALPYHKHLEMRYNEITKERSLEERIQFPVPTPEGF